jgi:hypothetical protein
MALQELLEKQAADQRFLAGSHMQLQKLEQAWARKRVIYQQQQLERQSVEIKQARLFLRVIEQHAEHFQQVWEREDRIARQARRQQREQQRGGERERDRGGLSR